MHGDEHLEHLLEQHCDFRVWFKSRLTSTACRFSMKGREVSCAGGIRSSVWEFLMHDG